MTSEKLRDSMADILLVAEGPLDAASTFDALREHGVGGRVHVAQSSAEAMDFLLERGPFEGHNPLAKLKLIILNLHLSNSEDIELLETARRDPRTSTIPSVVLTTTDERELVAKRCAGANSYIERPRDMDQYAETVRGLRTYWIEMNQTSGH